MEYAEEFFIGMDEYRGIYAVERKMHCRPLCEVAELVGKILEESDAYVFIRNNGNEREIVDALSVMDLTANMIGYPPGSQIEIIVKGKRGNEILLAFADEVAKVFCKKD